MRLLLTGAGGQLGTDLRNIAEKVKLLPLTHHELDITDSSAVYKACQDFLPDVIINTAAYVRVDDCETNADAAFSVNSFGARNLAVASQQCGAKLCHISTDYVFGGEGITYERPITEFDTPAPVNTYGSSKLAGENHVRHLCKKYFIVRTSAVFGTAESSGKGGNFVETILQLAKERNELSVVNDQRFSPTYTLDLAAKIVQLIKTDSYGTFHLTNSGTCTWYEFTREILRIADVDVKLSPIASEDFPRPAKRPSYSVLDNYCLRLLGLDDMRPWQDALEAYMKERNDKNEKR